MAYINNYREPIELEPGATTAQLALPDGSYRLTLSDEAATRWEIVDAEVLDGSATLTRGLEGTTDQAWTGGSVIYCAVTAEQLNDLVGHLYWGDGNPNGVLNVPYAGSHYCDTTNMTFWISGNDFNGQTQWHLQEDGGAFVVVASGAEYSEGQYGSFVVPSGYTMTFAGDPLQVHSNVQMTIENGVASYSTAGKSLVQISPIYGEGRLVLITPVFQPTNPI